MVDELQLTLGNLDNFLNETGPDLVLNLGNPDVKEGLIRISLIERLNLTQLNGKHTGLLQERVQPPTS